MSEHEIRSHRAPSKHWVLFAALLFLTASITFSVTHHVMSGDPQQVADPGPLSVVQECQQALGYPARTEADILWLQDCVHALTPPTVPPTTPPTGPPSTTTPPSTPPTTSAPPTTPPTTTPPVTTTTPPVTPSPTTASPSPVPTTTTPPVTTSTPPGTCPVSGSNVPGAKDPWGGCWPGPGNTGVPAGTSLTPYTGPCTITVANTVISQKTVTCSTLSIHATGVMISKSLLNGTDVSDGGFANASFVITDSTVVNGAREQCFCIGDHNYVVSRVEVRGGNRSMYCASTCQISDSWLHGQQLQGAQHGSGLREEQFTTATHNTLVCDYPFVNDQTTLGCSADLTGYPDFAPIKNNTIKRNLFLASTTVSFCSYGGATKGKPYSGDPTNATNQVFVENVYQRGSSGRCGPYGPIADWGAGRTGNVWSGNVFDNGTVITP